MKIIWEWPKSSIAANLVFDKGTDNEVLKKVDSLLSEVGFDGHVVIAGHSFSKKEEKIFMRKWNHFEWPEVCAAVEQTIKQHFPETIFENSKAA